jgi:hypothetical protein
MAGPSGEVAALGLPAEREAAVGSRRHRASDVTDTTERKVIRWQKEMQG